MNRAPAVTAPQVAAPFKLRDSLTADPRRLRHNALRALKLFRKTFVPERGTAEYQRGVTLLLSKKRDRRIARRRARRSAE